MKNIKLSVLFSVLFLYGNREACAKRLGKSMKDSPNDLRKNSASTSSKVKLLTPQERPPILYIRPMIDLKGEPIIFNNKVSIEANDPLPDFKKPLRKIVFKERKNLSTLPDFGQIIIEKTEELRSKDKKGEFFVDYGNANAGILPLASSRSNETSSNSLFPPFLKPS